VKRDPAKRPKTKTVHISEELHSRARKYVAQKGMKLGFWVEDLVTKNLEK